MSTFQPHFDFKRISSAAEYITSNIKNRKSKGDIPRTLSLYEEYSNILARVNALRAERNTIASSKDMDATAKREAGKRIKDELQTLEPRLNDAKRELDAEAMQLPCDTHPAAPVGPEDAAVTLATHGAPLTSADLGGAPVRDHLQIGEKLGLFDFSAASSIAGSGFAVLRNDAVLLELALAQWALARVAAAGFSPTAPPDLAHSSLVEGCGFNPRDTPAPGADPSTGVVAGSSQVYSIKASELCLIGTSEIPLAGMHAGQLIDPAKTPLPALYSGFSHCFRREAGANGQRDRGLYRLHQFSKVEMFAFVAPTDDPAALPLTGTPLSKYAALTHRLAPWLREDGTVDASVLPAPAPCAGLPPSLASEALFRRMVDLQISLYADLGLHFRVLDMPTEELGAAAYRKIDIEAWMPGRRGKEGGGWGEISSASNCIDYQARRLNIRYKAGQGHNAFVHTLNATALAVPRIMLTLLETHQRADGSVAIPETLQPFMGGRTELQPPKRV